MPIAALIGEAFPKTYNSVVNYCAATSCYNKPNWLPTQQASHKIKDTVLMIHTTQRPGFDRRMTKEEINDCPIIKFEGTIQLIDSEKDAHESIAILKKERILGFDTETKPAFKKGQHFPPSLLQLAYSEGVFLFQLKNLHLPGPLIEIFTDPGIIKAGVSLNFDIAELQKIEPFSPAGFIDLGVLARKNGIKNHGLRGLTAVLLKCRISKTAQRSNWSNDTLTPAQIKYAATDAWIGRELYLKLQNTLKSSSPCLR